MFSVLSVCGRILSQNRTVLPLTRAQSTRRFPLHAISVRPTNSSAFRLTSSDQLYSILVAPVEAAIPDYSFGIAWVLFALAIALHVADEAKHDFLSTYNPTARAIRTRLPLLPIPIFTFRIWLTLLIAGIILLLCLSPLALHGNRWLRIASWPLAILVGVFNAAAHLAGSAYFRRWLPGTYSSPLLLAASIYLLATS
jgi:hypothetical protein